MTDERCRGVPYARMCWTQKLLCASGDGEGGGGNLLGENRPSPAHTLDAPKAVPNEVCDAREELLDERPRHLRAAVLNDALHDAAAIHVRREEEERVGKDAQDEGRATGDMHDDGGDDVVAVCVLDALCNVPVKLLHDAVAQLHGQVLERTLQDAAAKRMLREVKHLTREAAREEGGALLVGSCIEKGRDDEVA